MGNNMSGNSCITTLDTVKLLGNFGVFEEFLDYCKEADTIINQQSMNTLEYANYNFTSRIGGNRIWKLASMQQQLDTTV